MLRQEGVVAFGFRDGDPSIDLFPPDPNAGAACLEFDRPIGSRELGVGTQAAYRRQGLATIACAHLIKLCEVEASHAYWDCAKLNRGSAMLARKLGFQNERAYKWMAWFKPKE